MMLTEPAAIGTWSLLRGTVVDGPTSDGVDLPTTSTLTSSASTPSWQEKMATAA